MKNIFILLFTVCLFFASFAQTDWINTYNYSLKNFIKCIDTTSEHGYFIAGGYKDASSGGDYFAAKLDSNGNEIWHRYGTLYNGLTHSNFANCIVNAGDGGCLVGGGINNTNDDRLYFVRLDSSGNILWEKTLLGTNYQYLGGIVKIDNNYYCNYFYQVGPIFTFLLKLNDQGDSISSYGLNQGMSPFPSSILVESNKNIIVFGGRINALDSNLINLSYCEIDTSGNINYTKDFSDSISYDPVTISQNIKSEFVFSGYNFQNGITKIVMIDSSGTIKWENLFNQSNYSPVTMLNDSNACLSLGTWQNIIKVIKFDSTGYIIGSNNIPTIQQNSEVYDNLIDWNGDLIICGNFSNSSFCVPCVTTGFVMKIKTSSINVVNEHESLSQSNRYLLYPNPTSGTISIFNEFNLNNEAIIELSDVMGRNILRQKMNTSNSLIEFDLTKFENGFYSYRIISDNVIAKTGIIIIQH